MGDAGGTQHMPVIAIQPAHITHRQRLHEARAWRIDRLRNCIGNTQAQ